MVQRPWHQILHLALMESEATHAAARWYADSSSASPPRSSGSGCAASCSLASRSPWIHLSGREELTRAGPTSPGEFFWRAYHHINRAPIIKLQLLLGSSSLDHNCTVLINTLKIHLMVLETLFTSVRQQHWLQWLIKRDNFHSSSSKNKTQPI